MHQPATRVTASHLPRHSAHQTKHCIRRRPAASCLRVRNQGNDISLRFSKAEIPRRRFSTTFSTFRMWVLRHPNSATSFRSLIAASFGYKGDGDPSPEHGRTLEEWRNKSKAIVASTMRTEPAGRWAIKLPYSSFLGPSGSQSSRLNPPLFLESLASSKTRCPASEKLS